MVNHHQACVDASIAHRMPRAIVNDASSSPLPAHALLSEPMAALELATGYLDASQRA